MEREVSTTSASICCPRSGPCWILLAHLRSGNGRALVVLYAQITMWSLAILGLLAWHIPMDTPCLTLADSHYRKETGQSG